MASCRPLVSVHKAEDGSVGRSVVMPAVFTSPLRPDLVRYVHSNMAKNKRQAYGVSVRAGYQSSAESWGTGRAVSRIPRVPGGGTHRAGQGAFGNMCRGGGMFNPNKTWRRWHRKVNRKEKRQAVCTAVSASGIPALVMARGHRVDAVPELPLVVEDSVEGLEKTRDALKLLKVLGCGPELDRVSDSKKIRAGVGKQRGRRYVIRRGPLVVYGGADLSGKNSSSSSSGGGMCPLPRACRNIPGVELCHVDRLNLLKLAPGGTFGRLVVWTESAFRRLNEIYTTTASGSGGGGNSTCGRVSGFNRVVLPRPLLTNADVSRIINSDEVQATLRTARKKPRRASQLKNPLKNRSVMCRLNPAAKHLKNLATLKQMKGTKEWKVLQGKVKKLAIQKKQFRSGERAALKGGSGGAVMPYYDQMMLSFAATARTSNKKAPAETAIGADSE